MARGRRQRGRTGSTVCGQGRGRTADLSLFRRALVPTELPAPRRCEHRGATLTGLEPATSAVTGRRANQLRYRAKLWIFVRAPNGVRTRATALKGRRPGPIGDGGLEFAGGGGNNTWPRGAPGPGVARLRSLACDYPIAHRLRPSVDAR